MTARRLQRYGDRLHFGVSAWIQALGLGLIAGIATAISVELALGIVVTATALYAFARSSVQSEVIVAIYWFTFCIFSSIFASVSIAGFYFPFYGAFLLVIAIGLIRAGIQFQPPLVLASVGFVSVALASLVGYQEASATEAFQRLLAYAFAVIIALQIRSARGLAPILAAAAMASLVISVWVVWEAAQSGFVYRAGLDVNQNVVTLLIGLGLIPVASLFVSVLLDRRRMIWGAPLLVALTVMTYAIVVLASRGMTIALAVALIAIIVRSTLRDRRSLLAVVLLALVVAAGMMLPGGQGIMDRFSSPDTETGNERLPIWEATIDAFSAGDVREITLGHGLGSSQAVVQQRFGSLTSTHNAYLQVLYELGLIGLALFTFIHVALLIRSTRVYGVYGLTMLGLIAFLMIGNLAMSASDTFLYWTAIGVAMAISAWAPQGPVDRRARDAA